jgi:hypothetical protein
VIPTTYLARLRVLASRALHAFAIGDNWDGTVLGFESLALAARREYVQGVQGRTSEIHVAIEDFSAATFPSSRTISRVLVSNSSQPAGSALSRSPAIAFAG